MPFVRNIANVITTCLLSELPTSGNVVGDLAYTQDTNQYWVAVSGTDWDLLMGAKPGTPVNPIAAQGNVIINDYTAVLSDGVDFGKTLSVNGVDLVYGTDIDTSGITSASDLSQRIADAIVSSALGQGTQASGTITFGSPNPGDTINLNSDVGDNNVLTCVASSPGANEFTSIGELTALINALPTFSYTEGIISVAATDDGTTITVHCTQGGSFANGIGLVLGAGNTGSMTVSAPTLSGGTDASVTAFRNDPTDGNTKLTANVFGAGGNSIPFTTDATTATSLDGSGTFHGGANGTPGAAGAQMYDASFLYIAVVQCTLTTGGWAKIPYTSA